MSETSAEPGFRAAHLGYLRAVAAALGAAGVRLADDWTGDGDSVRWAGVTVTVPPGTGSPGVPGDRDATWRVAWFEDYGWAVGSGKAGLNPLYWDSAEIIPAPGQVASAVAARIAGSVSGWVTRKDRAASAREAGEPDPEFEAALAAAGAGPPHPAVTAATPDVTDTAPRLESRGGRAKE